MLNRFWRHVRGTVAIEFAFVLPLLLMFTIGVLEFGIILFDYQRAGEATRRGVRDLVINPPLAALDTLLTDGSVVCIGSGASVSCTGGAVDGDAATTFAVIVEKMQDIFSSIAPQNVSVVYNASGVDDPANTGMITPTVTLSLTGLQYEFLLLQIIPGIPTGFEFPPFATTRLASTQAL